MSLIRIITVGGTIDKIYFDAKSSYEVGPPNITEVLSGLSLNLDYGVVSLMQKDSLEMTDADREAIRQAVSETIEDMIVITHGTDTMFNIGAAFTAVQTKPAGVYIAMNGVIFDHDRVRKDVENNKFVAL